MPNPIEKRTFGYVCNFITKNCINYKTNPTVHRETLNF